MYSTIGLLFQSLRPIITQLRDIDLFMILENSYTNSVDTRMDVFTEIASSAKKVARLDEKSIMDYLADIISSHTNIDWIKKCFNGPKQLKLKDHVKLHTAIGFGELFGMRRKRRIGNFRFVVSSFIPPWQKLLSTR